MRWGSTRALLWYALGMCGRYYRIADKQAIVDHFHSPAATDEPFPPRGLLQQDFEANHDGQEPTDCGPPMCLLEYRGTAPLMDKAL